MDQQYMGKMGAALLQELTSIQKQAMDKEGFILGAKTLMGGLKAGGRFLSGGARRIGQAVTKQVPMGMTRGGEMASRIGGAGATRAGGIGAHMKQIYAAGKQGRIGVDQAGKLMRTGGGTLGGVKALASSRYGQMAAVPALGAAGLYAVS